ncbi:MAG: ribosome recycling factor [Candidatus Taylorbacteria bacterium RIFCSPLOWO2_01_FULL_45_15b]|uniref:Ribosome recycling factor n=1 Tax=Candidatus Taylorbacteria bacterium RIFCSPLOWO2_01_FULL_45_15b TaxID=1802319 RepID=A0A1G2NEK7_9BACT|nr:MAG: ribosome recycling factor [Candidatus Taylorbacteria bacterium RIFCSPLOWO2_01_FULL_45_15b]
MYNFTETKKRFSGIEEWLGKEYLGLRSGQATPSILDGVMIESYGSKQPLKHVAAISIEDAKTLRIAPWDASQIKDIEKAILVSNLGLSARPDDTGVRVSFPELTAERRTSIIKVAKEKLEEAKISVRKEREKTLKDIDAKEKEGTITEDEVKRLKAELQKMVDAVNAKLEESRARKEKEIAG